MMTIVEPRIIADQLSGGIDSLALIGNTLATGAKLLVLISVLVMSLGHLSTQLLPLHYV